MKSVHSFSVVRALIVAISTVSMFSNLAYAQDAVGTFTLPYEVHWGKAILAPGDYKYSIESSGPAALLMVRKSSGSPGFIVMSQSSSHAGTAGGNRLVLQRRGSDRFVASMYLAELEEVLYFEVPGTPAEVAHNAGPVRTAGIVTPAQ